MTPILSVIVPLHNAGNLFIPFLESLIAQKEKNIEIIIINDGSTDGSGEIARHYCEEHTFITVIDQVNSGVSIARNAGINIARGKYVAFPDADDVLAPEMYSTLINHAESNELDVMQCNGQRYWESNGELTPIIPPKRLESTGVIDGVTFFNRALKTQRFIHVVWLAIYRLDFIIKNNLFFEPGLHHQDIPWTTEVMLNAERVQYLSTPLYRQRIHQRSISNRVRVGQANVEYQRHYMKIVKMLTALNDQYSEKIKGFPMFHWQITREALGICHSIRREPESSAQQQIAHEFYQHDIISDMVRNTYGIKQGWQVMLWLHRLKKWHQPLRLSVD
ncbi:glycosyltransferase [Edaphovirga cremea]|uniref:glycosyltransferase n=1 Tax=Edaphovirga cremea TaxID=2267246 RepID=UPI003988C931